MDKFVLLAATVLLGACELASSPRETYELAAQGIYAGELSADSSLSVVGSLNHGASLWRNGDHERLYNWTHKPGEFADLVATGFSADGTRAVTTDPRTLVVWDTRTGEAQAFWTTPAAVLDVALLPGGEQVFMGLEDHSAILFDAELGDHLQTFLHEGVVGSVDVSGDGLWALTASDDETAVLWNLSTGDKVHTFQHQNPVRVAALSNTGRYVFSAAQGKEVALWDGASGNRLHTLYERNRGITSARFSADERLLLVGYVNRIIELWDVASGTKIQQWNAKARNSWHPTGAAILAVGFSQTPSTYYALAGDGRLVELRRS